MSDITYGVTLSSGSTFSFTDTSTTYYLADYTPAGIRRRRDTSTAPDVAGVLETASVPEGGTIGLQIRVAATSGSALQTAVDALTTAFSAAAYQMAVTFDGVTLTYRARAADWSTPISELAFSHRREVILSVPVDPYPL